MVTIDRERLLCQSQRNFIGNQTNKKKKKLILITVKMLHISSDNLIFLLLLSHS